MSQSIQTALPWIIYIIAALIFVPSIIEYLKYPEKYEQCDPKDVNWMVEGIAIGMCAGNLVSTWIGKTVICLCVGILIGMFIGSKIPKGKNNKYKENNHEETV